MSQNKLERLAEQFARLIDENEKLKEENRKLHERLEDNHVFDMEGNRQDVKPGSIPDGIDCRDTTIKIQDEQIDRLSSRAKKCEQTISTALATLRAIGWQVDTLINKMETKDE